MMVEPEHEPSRRLRLPPPPAALHPALALATDHLPGLRDFVKWQTDQQRKQRDEDVQDFAADVIGDIDDLYTKYGALEERIDAAVDIEFFWSQEFFTKFSAAASEYAISPDQVKRRYLRAFVVQYSRNGRPDLTVANIFWRLVRDLSGAHLALLDALYRAQGSLDDIDLGNLRPERSEAVSKGKVAHSIGYELDLVALLVSDLRRSDLLRVTPAPSKTNDRTDRLILTSVGRRFMHFLLED